MIQPTTFTSLIAGIAVATVFVVNPGSARRAPIADFNFFVSIEVNGVTVGGGAVVDDLFVITTNTPLSGAQLSQIKVRLGTSKQGHRGAIYNVVQLRSFYVPGYTKQNDSAANITMLKLQASIYPYSPDKGWVNVNVDCVKKGQNMTLVAWQNYTTIGSHLLATRVGLLDSDECSAIYGTNMTQNQYCLKNLEGNEALFPAKGSPVYDNEQLYGLVTSAPDPTNSSDTSLVIMTTMCETTALFILYLCEVDSLI